MSKNGATACDNAIGINYRLDQIAIVCHLRTAALQRYLHNSHNGLMADSE